MAVSEEVILKIKDGNDIVDIVSEVVRLKKSGRNYFGLCPFHHEDSPSFSVSQDKQIYKCFGCGEAGNSITFVMKTKNFPISSPQKIFFPVRALLGFCATLTKDRVMSVWFCVLQRGSEKRQSFLESKAKSINRHAMRSGEIVFNYLPFCF